MLTIQRFKPIACLVSLALFASCATVKDTGRSSFNVVPREQEKQMGKDAFEQYKKEKPVANDPEKMAQLQRVAERLKKVIDIPDAEWEFVLFQDDTPNAFALPGGKVGVHTGIFPITKTDAGLAAVVGHEIGHVVARHGGERVSQAMTAQLGASALQALLSRGGKASSTETGLIGAALGLGANVGVLLPFGRKQELEADQLGALYMARAGYDPEEAVQLWVRFSEATKGKEGPEFLSTHPVNSTRIQKLKEFMPKAKEEYTKSPHKQ